MNKKFLTALTLAALGFGLMVSEGRAETENQRIQEQRIEASREARPPMREDYRAPVKRLEDSQTCTDDSDCPGNAPHCCNPSGWGGMCSSDSCW
jgi:hypothetical protein